MLRFKKVLSVSYGLLSHRDRIIFVAIGFVQLILALLDLVGVFLIGLITTLSLYGINSKQYPESLQTVISNLGLGNLSLQYQVGILGTITAILLVGKTFTTASISKRILFFLNLKSAKVTSDILDRVLSQPYDFSKGKSPTELLFSMTRGASALLTGVLGAFNIIISEVALILIMFAGLLLIDPIITLFALFYFGTFALMMSKKLNRKAEILKNESTNALIDSENQIIQALNLYRELHVRNARNLNSGKFLLTRVRMAELQSRNQFLPYIAKFNIEILLVLGSSILAASQFLLKDAVSAISTLSVFLAASLRISPAILRLQQGLIQFRTSVGESRRTLSLLKDLDESPEISMPVTSAPIIRELPQGRISFKNVNFSYRDETRNSVTELCFEIEPRSSLALVGPSGHGKSTILDLAIGSLFPKSGSVELDGLPPQLFIDRYPFAIGYVPQESSFFDGSIRENLLLGLPANEFEDDHLMRILDSVGLKEIVRNSRNLLDAKVGDRGLKFSVGQRQRLNIARALIPDPSVLILDEPTSALDVHSETVIADLLRAMKGQKTLLVIAHRLSTIQFFDKIAIVRDGKIVSTGDYNSLKDEIKGTKGIKLLAN